MKQIDLFKIAEHMHTHVLDCFGGSGFYLCG